LVQAVWTQIGADYFRTLGLPMVHGREFSAADERRGDEGVAIIDQVTAERLFAGTDPVGQFIQHAGSGAGEPPVRLEVIGVARPIRHQQIDLAPGPHVYTLYAANPPGSAFVQVRSLAGTADSEAALMSALRRRIQAALPDLPVISIVSLSTFRDEALMVTILRLGATAFVGFAVMALLIATIGVYGVKAYLVTNRTREIGIRLTLGATPRDILRLVLRQGLGVTVSGVGVGLVLSWLVSQAVQGVVLNTGAFDLLAFAGAALVLGLTVLLASWLPARRATRVAPTTFSRS
jgi:putative ABC transport system permease protein